MSTMSLWLYLVLAHLIADFVLQTGGIVRLKQRPVGMAVHVAMHGAVMAVLAAPVVPRWWLVIPAITAVHYLIDWSKMHLAPATGPRGFLFFLVDQGIHLGILAVAAIVAGLPPGARVSYGGPTLTMLLYYAVPYLTVTFAGAILVFQLALAFDTRPQPLSLLSFHARLAGYLERGLVLTAVLFLQPALWWVGLAAYVPQLGNGHRDRGWWIETLAGAGLAVGLGLVFRSGAGR